MLRKTESSKLDKSISYNNSQFESIYELDYYKSIENDIDKFCPQNLINRYLEMEDKNDRIQKLKYQFTTDKKKKLTSINDSVVYQSQKNRNIFTPESNFMKHRTDLITNRAINVRETNVRHMNNFLKFKKQRYAIWQSGITTLPGSKLGLKQNETTRSILEKQTTSNTSRCGSRRNSDALSNCSRQTSQTNKRNLTNFDKKTSNKMPKPVTYKPKQVVPTKKITHIKKAKIL